MSSREETQEFYLSLLHKELAPALGCTEPAAAALGAAYASSVLEEKAVSAEVFVSSYILKNGMNVGIPGTKERGLAIASAMGLVSGKPEKELMVLSRISEEEKAQAHRLKEEGRILIRLAETEEKLFIQVNARSKHHKSTAVLSGNHKNLVYLELDDKVLFKKEVLENTEKKQQKKYDISLKEIVEFIKGVPKEDLYFLREVIDINQGIAAEGLKRDYGLKVGQSILKGNRSGLIEMDTANYAVAMTAAAADARMSGCERPVMSTAGSGNQGLTATVPVIAVGQRLHLSEETILRALALSILFTIHTKQYLGRLSVLCGCSISAAMGVGCAVVYMLGGNYDQMSQAVLTMTADISGVVCDGAKPGCALKIATAVDSALRAANMALHKTGAGAYDGIVCSDVEETLCNLGTLGNEGMRETNPVILQMMLQKQEIQKGDG